MFPVGGVNLTELSQRLPSSPEAVLSPSVCFGSSSEAGAAWSYAPTQFRSCAEGKLSALSSNSLLDFCNFLSALYSLSILLMSTPNSQAVRTLGICHQQLLGNTLRCHCPSEPIQSHAVLQAHGKHKTAQKSKWIPQSAEKRRVPHWPVAHSCFLFFAV